MSKTIDSTTYIAITSFLYRLKIVHGNDFVNATLRKHPKLAQSLLDYEKSRIIKLEREI